MRASAVFTSLATLILPALAGLAADAAVAADRAGALDGVKPGEWFSAPASRLDAVKPDPLPVGNSGIASVMSAWSGGGFDTKRDRLVVWGGGHGDYSGNEVYVFSLDSLKWIRASDPSTDVGGVENSGKYPDGNPRARHTYNYVLYVPAIDRFCTLGGAALYPSGQTGSDVLFCFDFAARKWEDRGTVQTTGIGSLSGYDATTGTVWSQAAGNNGAFASWDAAGNIWKGHGSYDGWLDYNYTAAVGLGKFVAVGKGKVLVWDLAKPGDPVTSMLTTGDTAILAASCPGFVFDPKAGLFVAWAGGKDVYALDLAAKKWTRLAVASTNTVTPTAAEANGTYGRFQYSPSSDVFVGVNAVDQNVFIFKPPEGLHAGAVRPIATTLPQSAPYIYRGGLLRVDAGLRIFDGKRLVRRYAPPQGTEYLDPELAAGAYFAVPERVAPKR